MPNSPFDDPYAWFDAWFSEASQLVSPDPNAMTVSTIGPDGAPSSRVVLLKDWDERGFVFYTNRQSRKGSQLADRPFAALNFFWRELGRQIRIEGEVAWVDDEESDAYFATRPRLSQIGAWASLQSQPLDEWQTFDDRVAEFDERFAGGPVPRPDHWGGYRVIPSRMEFWKSGDYRLHERWLFRRLDEKWIAGMLYP